MRAASTLFIQAEAKLVRQQAAMKQLAQIAGAKQKVQQVSLLRATQAEMRREQRMELGEALASAEAAYTTRIAQNEQDANSRMMQLEGRWKASMAALEHQQHVSMANLMEDADHRQRMHSDQLEAGKAAIRLRETVLEKEHQAAMQARENEWQTEQQEQIRALQQRHVSEADVARAEHAEEVKALKEAQLRADQAWQATVAKLERDHSRECDVLQTELDQLRADTPEALQQLETEWKSKLAAWQVEGEEEGEQLRDEIARLHVELGTVQGEHMAKAERMLTQHDMFVARLRRESLRQLQLTLLHAARAEMAMWLQAARRNKTEDEASVMAACLEADQTIGNHVAALRQLAIIVMVQLRGAQGAALQAIRMSLNEDRRKLKLRTMQLHLDAKLRVEAVRELRATMWRLVKGDVAMRVELWRTRRRWSMMQAILMHQNRLHAEMMSGQKASALKQVTIVMAGAMRGVKGAALQSIRTHMSDDRRQQELCSQSRAQCPCLA